MNMVNNDPVTDTESLDSDLEIENSETGLTIQPNSVRSISDAEFCALSLKNNCIPLEYYAHTLPPNIRKTLYKLDIHDDEGFSTSDSELDPESKTQTGDSELTSIVITDNEDKRSPQPST